jgi:hypothetical protein
LINAKGQSIIAQSDDPVIHNNAKFCYLLNLSEPFPLGYEQLGRLYLSCLAYLSSRNFEEISGKLPSLREHILFLFFLFIYSYVHTLFGPFLPLTHHPLLLPSPTLLPDRTCSALSSSFVEEKT